ncbi:MAG: acetylglutamate kinase [Thermoplasmatota archaeon]
MKRVPFLLEFLPYIQQFRGKTFVLKIGGSVLKDKEVIGALAKDISLLYNVGITIILIHGGGPQADEMLGRLNHRSDKIAGRRITDEETLEVTKMVYGGKVNIELTAALQGCKTRAVGFSGVSCNTVCAKKRDLTVIKDPETGEEKEVDFGHVGDITQINLDLVNDLVKEHIIPVIACLGVDDDGSILNINADTISQKIAETIEAEKLIYITNVPGILEEKDDPSTIIPYLDLEGAEAVLKSGKITDGMLPKLQNAINAVEKGVDRIHLIDGNMDHSLLVEVFTNQGCGTMIEKETDGELFVDEN